MKKTPSHSYKFSPSREAQLGAKVILLSNEDVPPVVGTISRWSRVSKNDALMPIVKCDETGQEFLSFGLLLPYSSEMLTMIDAVDRPIAWYVLRDTGWLWADLLRIENPAIEAALAPKEPAKKTRTLFPYLFALATLVAGFLLGGI